MSNAQPEKRVTRWLANLFLVQCSLLAVFAVAEVGARYYLMHALPEREFLKYASVDQLAARGKAESQQHRKYAPHRYLGYFPAPNFSRGGESHNALGYRGGEVQMPKPEGEFRIVCMGGSTTYTEFVSDNTRTYPYLLEQELRTRGSSRVTVVNAGFPGWSSWETLVDFEFRVLDLGPDLVIVLDSLNDWSARAVWPPDAFRGDNSGYRAARFSDVFVPPWYEHSTLVRMLLIRLGYSQPHCRLDRSLDPHAATSYAQRFMDQVSTGAYPSGIFNDVGIDEMLRANSTEYFRRNLENVVSIAQTRGIATVLATTPWSTAFEGEWVSSPLVQESLREQNHVIRSIASEQKVHLFDYASAFPAEKRYFLDGRHVTEEGARLQAKLFADYLVSAGLVPK